MEEELGKYGLRIRWSDSPEREPIDFSIENDEDNVVWVWGSEPFSDVQIECNHPEECVQFGDDDEQGECAICGAKCDWQWTDDVVDEGHDEDGAYFAHVGEVRQITEWYYPKKFGGIVGKYLKHLQEKW